MRKSSLCLSPATGCGGQTRALAAAELPEESSPARMENRQNTGLKKRKLLRTVREQEPAIKEMCQALKEMESKVKNLRDDNNRLRGELLDKDRQLAVTRTLLVDRERQLTKTQTLLADREQQLEARTLLVDTKEFETEILRLKHLLAEGEPWRSGKAAAL
ncbi:uncharacterized protein LOC119271508 isoform X2 [Triticum dicoccoides]|uniref:uncharacterized protein LOC119271508 isoform X2 n=1 Tax=Triticum dicoccoides TaxID=85692 RepID=UPI00188E1EE0|nr:uncharacterized protein LOC119271508 isoform X2 [Triticum dicoccoides]